MRLSSAEASQLYECDSCGVTVLCTPQELRVDYRWREHEGIAGGIRWTLLLCAECKQQGETS